MEGKRNKEAGAGKEPNIEIRVSHQIETVEHAIDSQDRQREA